MPNPIIVQQEVTEAHQKEFMRDAKQPRLAKQVWAGWSSLAISLGNLLIDAVVEWLYQRYTNQRSETNGWTGKLIQVGRQQQPVDMVEPGQNQNSSPSACNPGREVASQD